MLLQGIDKIVERKGWIVGQVERKCFHGYSRLWRIATAASFLVACGVAVASGPTSEEEAISSILELQHPMVLSGDGNWLIYVDDNGTMHREPAPDGKKAKKAGMTIDLGMVPQSLAASQDGHRVAMQSAAMGGCIGLFDSNRTGDKIIWKRFSAYAEPSFKPGETCVVPSRETTDAISWQAQPIALTKDGKTAAVLSSVEFGVVFLVDVDTMRIKQRIPSHAWVLALRFLHDDAELFVEQAVLGEGYESPSKPSDMQFAVWDLQHKQLHNFFHTGTGDNLFGIDMLFAFSEDTDQLWTFNTRTEQFRSSAHPENATMKPVVASLMQCGAHKADGPVLPSTIGQSGAWQQFAADPLGRWIAEASYDYTKRGLSLVTLRDAASGKVLTSWKIDAPVRTLLPSHDGRMLYATLGRRDPQTGETAMPPVGDVLRRFRLGPFLAGLPLAASATWSDSPCPIEDEAPGARELDTAPAKARKPVPLYTLDLTPAKIDDSDPVCARLLPDDDGTSHRWGKAGDQTLWIDRKTKLDQIDPVSGKVLRSIPTPRSATVCSLPLFERKQFLNWQGDTITLRPFSDTLDAGQRRVLVTRPGWRASAVEVLGQRFAVYWVDAKTVGQPADPQSPGKLGSAMVVVYDWNGKSVWELAGHSYESGAVFDDYQSGDNGNPADHLMQPREAGNYHWSMSYFGSVRAQQIAVGNADKTVFWHGLSLDVDIAPVDSFVAGLDGDYGARVDNEGITIYDAARHEQVARIPTQGAVDLAWDAEHRILVVEESKYLPMDSRTVRAWRIPEK